MNKPHQLVVLNGPRHSGKDHLASIIRRHFLCRHYKFSKVLKESIPHLYGLTCDWTYLEKIKLERTELLLGDSFVEAQIRLSERYLKREYGPDVFGRLAVNFMRQPTNTGFTVISDSGFEEELIPLANFTSPQNVHVIQLRRNGTSFERDASTWGDVRHYLSEHAPELKGVQFWSFRNDYGPGLTEKLICRAVANITGVLPHTHILKQELTADDLLSLSAEPSSEGESQ